MDGHQHIIFFNKNNFLRLINGFTVSCQIHFITNIRFINFLVFFFTCRLSRTPTTRPTRMYRKKITLFVLSAIFLTLVSCYDNNKENNLFDEGPVALDEIDPGECFFSFFKNLPFSQWTRKYQHKMRRTFFLLGLLSHLSVKLDLTLNILQISGKKSNNLIYL